MSLLPVYIFIFLLLYFTLFLIIFFISLEAAKAGKPLPDEDLTQEVYATADWKTEPQDFIRMPDYHKSIGNKL